ncbi:MAG: chitobiase/beta-hexosaminidase C-terminal domain-containing protein [Bacteroidota bacterium]
MAHFIGKYIFTAFLIISWVNDAHTQVELEFSQTRGFYDADFNLSLSASRPNAVIRYTLDGEEPTPAQGIIYTGAIPVTTTTVLRAIAFDPGVDTSRIYTHTYLFLEDVIRQSRLVEGWPNNTYSLGAGDQAVHDYGMDSSIVDSPLYSADILQGLQDIPSLSIVMPFEDFWDIYDGNAEKKTSIELLYADGITENEQVDCGVEPHSHFRLKRSMRLSFKSQYGESMWESDIFRNAALGGETAVDELDRIVLRGGNNRAWSRAWNPDRTAFTRDEWYRQSQLAASGIGSRGTFVHLYVNGLYWGLYNPVERPDESFTSSYLGGDKEDWFSVSHGGAQGGDPTRYDYLIDELIEEDMTNPMVYEELQTYLDVSAFSDYLIVSWMTGVSDWPGNNWWAGISNNPPGKLRYFGWDNEWSWDVTNNSNNGAWVHPQFRREDTGGNNSALIFNKAKVNDDFMMTFADRVYKLCFNNGALTDENSRSRWASLNNFIRNAVVAESARWGDSLEDGETRTRDIHWQSEVDRVDALMDGNVQRFIDALIEEEYYPEIDPPLFLNEEVVIEDQEIAVPANFIVSLLNPNESGEMYFTTDGTDPRLPGGAIAPNAELYSSQEINVTNAITLLARIKEGNTWSALHCLKIFVQNDFSDLKITEIMYHPADFGMVSGTELEFLEIKNTSLEDPLDISGLEIVDGIEFTFPVGTVLQAQELLVIASNPESLLMKCPDIAIFGEYEGQLSNGGERIAFASADGTEFISLTYDDQSPWPTEADGDGPSLVPTSTNPIGSQDDASLWQVSQDAVCGSPGQDETTPSSTIRVSKQEEILIYPNPVSGGDPLILRSPEEISALAIYSNAGLKVYTQDMTGSQNEMIVLAPIQAGSYFIQVVYNSGLVEYKRIIVL